AVGEVVAAHGLHGLLRVRAYQPPAPSLAPDRLIRLEQAAAGREARIASAAPHGRGLVLVALTGVGARAAAEALVGSRVLVRTARLTPMRVHVLTLCPEMFGSPLAAGVLRRARERGALEVSLHQLRDYAGGRHLQVDDTPYGGGQGMVMKPEPLVAAIEHIAAADAPRRILLSPQGAAFSHERARALASERSLLLLCARYEGLDGRVTRHVDEELSIG